MKTAITASLVRLLITVFSMALAVLFVMGCSGGNGNSDGSDGPTGDFELLVTVDSPVLVEGDADGLVIPLSLLRTNDHSNPVQLDIKGLSTDDVELVTSRFTTQTLLPGADASQVVLKMSIDDRPIKTHTRNFIITASDAIDRDVYALSLEVQPTNAPDVYLLIGQSNMVGFSGDGTRQAGPGGADEPNARIRQLNVSKNDSDEIFTSASSYTSEEANIMEPDLVTAEDPLHIPLDPNNSGKGLEYIGLGLSFAKNALMDTTADIILVPAAWSGTAFCSNSFSDQGHWNAEPPANDVLGNTLLFDRAVTRTNLALQKSGGILRGILWHQGESDANDDCAPLYADNMVKLVRGLRSSIQPDLRGEGLRQPDSNIPFVAGTMSRGVDGSSDFSEFWPSKQMIDDVHRNLPNLVSHTALSNNDDLVPANGFPCGNSSCIHFGADALREMGSRYYQAMLGALSQ